MGKIDAFLWGIVLGLFIAAGVLWFSPAPEPVVKYIYDGSIGHDAASEARLVGFCNGKYLIRTEEDEFPASGCVFIEPISWEGQKS